ncbi:Fatty acid oxidation complex subunit alpha [Roseibaca ekhonensis]|jgi:3-hydroxyacyl-CoA dehydrogenase|uniref:Fatty acid oxidation complex subunit alpha n=1 Tax=Roseinatronobacter ekhonensis TaxID=254356 RepID=A0A3B0MTB8_9RHOB|nr:FAD-dependent oxidoreductase [Roseibaca ekhonensis]SUZ31166.1 Fatty acid oxidation complex subunit alpha [Roseibaca ekhonensis]
MSISIAREGDIARVTLDNPPVNALGQAQREGLADAVAQTNAMDGLRAVVLHCAGRSFVAGADIREFGKPPEPPHLPDVLAQIEGARVPWVAAIHGTALGGGLELALACRYRVAARGAKLGLPEVTLGLIPGAGGTVRLPRIVPATQALQMVAGGKPVAAAQAAEWGLIDHLADGDALEAAVQFAATVAKRRDPGPVLARPVQNPDPAAFDALADRLTKRARGQHSPIEAVAALRRALTLPAPEAMAAEREAFLRLRDDPQSKALAHVFFAERGAARLDRLKGVAVPAPERVGVVGGGTMGAGIASACLLAGLRVTLLEQTADAAQAAQDRVTGILQDSLSRGVIAPDRHAALVAQFTATHDPTALADAQLVIEAVFEDFDVKKAVLAQLESVTPPECVLATNTSYLDVNALAATMSDPSRLVGLHFFSPAHVMKLLEIVVPDGVSDTALATGAALAKALGKIMVFAGVCDGFIANRIMSAYRAACEHMLEAGATPWEVDAAMVDFGFPMGIYQMQDLAGLDIAWAMRKRRAAEGKRPADYVRIPDILCEAGRFGRKAGRGWYDYTTGKPVPDPEVERVIAAESARKGIARRPFTAEDIMARILSVMQAEGAAILREGIASRAADIDVVMINAFGFPRWTGGPMYLRDAS